MPTGIKFPLIKLAKKLKEVLSDYYTCKPEQGFPLIKLAKKLKEKTINLCHAKVWRFH